MRDRPAYLEALVEAAPLLIIGLSAEGTVLQWNRAAEQILGWQASEVRGQVPPAELWGPGKQLTLAHEQSLRGQVWRNVELELPRRDGSSAVLSLSATAVPSSEGEGTWGVLFMAQDITFQQNAVDTLLGQVDQLLQGHRTTLDLLQRSERNFRTLIEQSPEAVVIHQQGRIAYVNPAGLRLLGYAEPSTVLGTDWSAMLHPQDRAAEAPAASRELRLLRSDGLTVIVELTELALEFDGRAATVVLARDITERKEIQARLLLADRLTSVGTLVMGIAHEINNPMSYVTANLVQLSSVLSDLAQAVGNTKVVGTLIDLSQAASEALEGAQRVNKIVKELQIFARGDDEHLEPINLQTVVRNSLNIAHQALEPRARLVLELEEVAPVLASASKLGQVCLNLLLNAGQSIPMGAADRNQIVIRTRQRNDGWVLLEIADTGSGISPEHQRRLFDPFFTTKPIGEGTGLGLSICHGIVTRLGGTIEVESALGHGSLFRIVLPPYSRDLATGRVK
jgi:PAS domain S-box-containing protein